MYLTIAGMVLTLCNLHSHCSKSKGHSQTKSIQQLTSTMLIVICLILMFRGNSLRQRNEHDAKNDLNSLYNYYRILPYSYSQWFGESMMAMKFTFNTIDTDLFHTPVVTTNRRNSKMHHSENGSTSSPIVVRYAIVIALFSTVLSCWLQGNIVQYIKLGIGYGVLGIFGYVITPIATLILQAELHEKSKQESIRRRCNHHRKSKARHGNHDDTESLWDR
jgi:multidrug transporter EmrE-like cation transporter